MKQLSLILLSLIFIFTVSCNNEETTDENTETGDVTNEAVIFNTADEMVEAAKAQIEKITTENFQAMAEADETFLLIDIRTKEEFDKGFIQGAVNIARGVLEFRIKKESFWEGEMLYMPKSDELIILCCKSGKRGSLAALTLQSMGFTNVKNLTGGYLAFKDAYPDSVEIPEGADVPAEGGEEDDGGC